MILDILTQYLSSLATFWTGFASSGFLRMLVFWAILYWIFSGRRRGCCRRRWGRGCGCGPRCGCKAESRCRCSSCDCMCGGCGCHGASDHHHDDHGHAHAHHEHHDHHGEHEDHDAHHEHEAEWVEEWEEDDVATSEGEATDAETDDDTHNDG